MKRSEVESTKQTLKGLCGLARKLGYKDPYHQLHNDDGTVVGDLLEFFEDNPGACEAVIEWVLDEGGPRDGSKLIDDDDEQEEENEDA